MRQKRHLPRRLLCRVLHTKPDPAVKGDRRGLPREGSIYVPQEFRSGGLIQGFSILPLNVLIGIILG